MSGSAGDAARSTHMVYRIGNDFSYQETPCFCPAKAAHPVADTRPLPLHRTEAGYPNCSTCDGGGCLDCTDPA